MTTEYERAAAASICKVANKLMALNLYPECENLVEAFDKKKIDDDMKEILRITAPSDSASKLDGWHLERMAADEYGQPGGHSKEEIELVCTELAQATIIAQQILEHSKERQDQRYKLLMDMELRHERLNKEIDEARAAIDRAAHAEYNPTEIIVGSPVPVNERILSAAASVSKVLTSNSAENEMDVN